VASGSHGQAQPLSGSMHQLFGLTVPDRSKDWLAFLENRIAKRIAKAVMEKTGIVKRIDKKIVQQVILSNCF
jgi:hypothetical protein